MANGCNVEKYPNFKRWLKEASEDPMLRIVCINILSEIFFENISLSKLEKILSMLDNYIEMRKEEGYETKKQIIDINETKFIGKGRKIKIDDNEILSVVLPLEKVRNFCTANGYDWDIGTKIDSPESIETLNSLIEMHNESNPVFLNFKGKNDIFWFTKAESLNSIKQNTKKWNIASLVRNALGLCINSGEILIEIKFESSQIENGKKPTIFDANFNIFFKPKGRRSNWGFTLDSETLDESLPEAIHEQKAIWPKIYKYEILGSPNSFKFPSKEKWRKLRKNSLNTLCKDGEIQKDAVCKYIVTEEEDWK